MPTDNTVLAPATAAGDYAFVLPRDQRALASASGLGAEVVEIHVWQGAAYIASGEELTAETPALQILGPGQFQLVKPITAAASGLYLD